MLRAGPAPAQRPFEGASAVHLHSVAIAPDWQDRGVGRAFIDALAEVANAPRLVAEVDEEAVDFYRACGFEVETAGSRGDDARFRCIRTLSAAPAAEPTRALTLAEIEQAVAAAWSAETADDPTAWSSDNPARDHCDVAALLVRELLGREILIANVIRDGRRLERHAWNRLSAGVEIDLTRSQFRDGERLSEPQVAEPLLGRDRDARYEAFAARVRASLGL